MNTITYAIHESINTNFKDFRENYIQRAMGECVSLSEQYKKESYGLKTVRAPNKYKIERTYSSHL